MGALNIGKGALLAVAMTALCLVSASAAHAQRRNPLIQRGSAQYEDLEFEQALQTLSAALVRAGNTRQDRTTIFRLLAFTYRALAREEEAEGAYRSLLALDPGFEPGPDVSPRTRHFFSGVRERWVEDGRPGLPPPAPVTIRHRSPAQAERGTPIALTARLDDPSGRVVRLVLAYRQGTDDVFRRVDTEEVEGQYAATIPEAAVAPPLVEYYFEGLDETGLPVAARGDVAAPLRVAVPADEGSILTAWWFWAGAAVLVGAAVTTGVLLSSGGGTEQGTLIITVPQP